MVWDSKPSSIIFYERLNWLEFLSHALCRATRGAYMLTNKDDIVIVVCLFFFCFSFISSNNEWKMLFTRLPIYGIKKGKINNWTDGFFTFLMISNTNAKIFNKLKKKDRLLNSYCDICPRFLFACLFCVHGMILQI